ncbi:MAG TPA: hypothetical protein VKB26_05575 [Candidatus Acidoferrales bacterium]|nr:hypothetical protein [Candidatus Acidoferrales bacterium]
MRRHAYHSALALSFLAVFVFAANTLPRISVGAAADTEGNALHSFCYAFLRQGNLFLRCNGSLVQLTKPGDVTDFAVSETGNAIAVLRLDNHPRTGRNLQVIPLTNSVKGQLLPLGHDFGGLIASCGTTLFIYRTAKDLLAGKDLDFKPYQDFQCSSDRKVIVGQVSIDSHGAVVTELPPGDSHTALVSGVPPNITKPRLANTGSEGFAYSVSPSGEYFAYYAPTELCLVQKLTTKTCTSSIDVLRQISVSDSGDIYFTMRTGPGCQYLESAAAKCIGIAVLRNGKHSSDIIEREASCPQWLTPIAASAIISWHHGE